MAERDAKRCARRRQGERGVVGGPPGLGWHRPSSYPRSRKRGCRRCVPRQPCLGASRRVAWHAYRLRRSARNGSLPTPAESDGSGRHRSRDGRVSRRAGPGSAMSRVNHAGAKLRRGSGWTALTRRRNHGARGSSIAPKCSTRIFDGNRGMPARLVRVRGFSTRALPALP